MAKEPPAPVAHSATPAQPTKPQWRPDAVTYVPVSSERLAERGFNQAERLATGLATACRLPIVDLLQRQINTTKQSFKSRGERIETMKNAFSISRDGMHLIEELHRGSHLTAKKGMLHDEPMQILLIDDIYTTGSTLDACGRVILNDGFTMGIPVEIYTLTLARS
ncbi:ComF family protein [Paenibacillus amylolyticus]|nr:ComF family protein [Paenibacillus amylolyticus]WFR64330.1 ComF family protein [Paenibacillus amylolyticus]